MANSNRYPKQEEESFSLRKMCCNLMDIIEVIAVTVFVILLCYAYMLRPIGVDGSSMMPTLLDKDKVIMWKLGYTPQADDIVIVDANKAFVFADDSNRELVESEPLGIRIVKRVIATEGQTLDINFETGKICRDGIYMDEPYISELTTQDEYAFRYPITIPEGYVFVMGDNRPDSTDSRDSHVGLVPVEQVEGRVIMRVYRDSEHCSSIFGWFELMKDPSVI